MAAEDCWTQCIREVLYPRRHRWRARAAFHWEACGEDDAREGGFDREFQQLLVAVLVSGANAGALAGRVPACRRPLLAVSVLCGGVVLWVSRHRAARRVRIWRDRGSRDGHVSEVRALGVCDSPCGGLRLR